jgi:outer membrane receptor protein involved in Fe transport
LLLSVAPLALATAVHAEDAAPRQDQTPVASASARDIAGAEIPEVVVTANRQAQNLQKVSTTVSVLDGSALKALAVTNIGQAFSNLPSVQATGQPGGFSIDVRGLGGDLPAGSTQGSVALVTDGVYNINSQSTTVGFFDVNRIEVLAGPQSTRYGPNADGGIVNLITNDPVLGKVSGEAALTVGNYSLFRGEAAINLPISDTVALRIAAAGVTRKSYFTPAEGDNKGQSIRAKLLFEPNDDFKLKLTYQLDHIGGTGNGSNVFPIYTNKVPVYPGDSINDLHDPWAQAPTDPVNVNKANIYQHTGIANLTYRFNPAVVLDMEASYSKITGGGTGCIYLPPWSTHQFNGYGPVFCGAELHEFAPFHQLTGEVRLHNGAGSAIQWNLGYYHWNYLEQYSLSNAAFLSSPPVKTTTATNAVYGEVTYPISDVFRVIGGARESFDHRTFNFNNAGTVTPVYGINFSHFDYRAGFEYDLAPKVMAYLTASSGYRPGGLSAFNPVTNAPNSFKSEVTRAFEAGVKSRLFDNRVQINADVFYYDQSNYQNLDKYSGFVPPEGGAPCSNGDPRAGCQTPTFGVQAHSLGLEAQIRANLTRNDILGLSATWLHARFDKKQGACATVAVPTTTGCLDGYNSESPNDPGAPFFFDLAGAVQPHSPKFSGSVSYQHVFRIRSGATISVGGDAFYTTGYWVNPVQDATLYGWQPSYWLENLSATFTSADGKWSLTAFMRNLSKYAVKQSVLPAQSIGDPRTFGATLGIHW